MKIQLDSPTPWNKDCKRWCYECDVKKLSKKYKNVWLFKKQTKNK